MPTPQEILEQARTIQSSKIVQHDIQIQQHDIQRKNETRSSVKYFENWLMGHLLYVDLEGFTIESLYYSPRVGFLVKLEGMNPIPDTSLEIPVNYFPKEEIVKKASNRKPAKRKPQPVVSPKVTIVTPKEP